MLGNVRWHVKHADGGGSGSTGGHYLGNVCGSNSSDGEHGKPSGGCHLRQLVKTSRRAAGFRTAVEDRPKNQVVDRVVFGGRHCLGHRVYRPADQKAGRRPLDEPRRAKRITSQMHAVRACREGDVESVVHEHSRRRTTNGVNAARDEARQRTAFQIVFTDLHEVNARRSRAAYAAHERLLPGSAQTPSIGDQAKDGTHVRPEGRRYFSWPRRPGSGAGSVSV